MCIRDRAYIPSFNNQTNHLSFSYKNKFIIIGSAHNLKEIRIKETQQVNQIFISSISIFQNSFKDSFNNLSNIEIIQQDYPLYELSQEIDSYFTQDYDVLAFDYNLILYYLDKPNFSYIVHPSNHFEEFIVTVLSDLNRIDENYISGLIEKEPDVIICNDWQTASVPLIYQQIYKTKEFYDNIKTVLTVHNFDEHCTYDRTVYDKLGVKIPTKIKGDKINCYEASAEDVDLIISLDSPSTNNTKKLLSLPLIKQNKKKLISIKVEDGETPNYETTSSMINEELSKHFA